MKVRPVATCTSMSVCTVAMFVVSPHHPRFVRALFVAHMRIAHTRVHSQDSGRADHAARDPSAMRTSSRLIARRHRLPFLEVATTFTSVRVEWHCLAPDRTTPNANSQRSADHTLRASCRAYPRHHAGDQEIAGYPTSVDTLCCAQPASEIAEFRPPARQNQIEQEP